MSDYCECIDSGPYRSQHPGHCCFRAGGYCHPHELAEWRASWDLHFAGQP